MADSDRTIQEIVAQLSVLTDKLSHATTGKDRRALLKEFRVLLEQADQCVLGGSSGMQPASKATS